MDEAKRSSRGLKRRVLDLLQTDDFDQGLNELCRLPARQVINPLFSSLCGPDERTKWRAVTAMGAVVANLAEKDMESARVVMRRLMWILNDESGAIGWGGPEAMAEIIASHAGLATEYAHILTSYVRKDGNFLEYESLQRGALWGLGRVAQSRPALVHDAACHLISYLDSSDAAVRGLAAWTVGLLRVEAARSHLEALLGDDSELLLYLNRRLVLRRVRDLAGDALAAIKTANAH